MTTLVFTLGPVQGFIAQSRRTADGWVGSFLLSYLSCRAALELAKHGEVVDPRLDGIALYEALKRGTSKVDGDLRVAGCPNNIVVELGEDLKPRDAGDAARQAVETVWRDVEEKVWAALPEEARSDCVESIWRRQTAGFWECYWAWGEHSTAAFDALIGRKGLRDFAQIQERGERCTLCAEREALWDGEPIKESVRADVRQYWRRWAGFLGKLGASRSVIKDDGSERLCAVCVVKRLVPWVDNPVSDLWKERDAVFPSTSTLATLRAKSALVRAAYGEHPDAALREALEGFAAAVVEHGGRMGRRAYRADSFRAWRAALDAVHDGKGREIAQRFLGFDGDCLLYGPSVQREHGLDAETRKDDHQEIRKAHRVLLRAIPTDRHDAVPSIYWALLAMDGDHMGALMRLLSARDPTDRVRQASGLVNDFARRVPGIVDGHDGRLVYAGGDDVLALFPVDAAVAAAEELRRTFGGLFGDWLATFPAEESADVVSPTLSGALVYAHHQTPLGRVVERGQYLLKHEAKEHAGRDAVAVEVRTRAGETLGFAARWVDGAGVSFAHRLDAVVKSLTGRQVASRFLYELQGFADVMGARGGTAEREPSRAAAGQDAEGRDDSERCAVLVEPEDRQAFVKSLAEKTRLAEAEEASEIAARLLALARVEGRAGGGRPAGQSPAFDLRPLLFARFLATGGREER